MKELKNIFFKTSRDTFLIRAFFSFIFFTSCWIFYNQAYNPLIGSDLRSHIEFTSKYFSGEIEFAHPGLHALIYYFAKISSLSLANTSILLLSFFQLLIAYIIFVVFKSQTKIQKTYLLLISTLFIFIATPIYVWFFNKSLYLGQISSAVWHNPTIIASKAFAFLSLLTTIPLLGNQSFQARKLIIPSICLFLSTIIKPNFAIAFIPAMSIYLIFKGLNKKNLYQVLIIIAPTVVLLLAQLVIYSSNQNNIYFDFLGVMRKYSPNVSISLLISILFPLLVLIFRWKVAINNPYLLISWLSLIISISYYATLAEAIAYEAGNFAWGCHLNIQLVFLFSFVEFISWVKELKNKTTAPVLIVAFSIFLHMISGAFYLIRLVLGYSYV